jgi:hypothetical protein
LGNDRQRGSLSGSHCSGVTAGRLFGQKGVGYRRK